MIIQVEGNIGAGKSYLCRQLGDAGLGWVAEERIDPAFLAMFYDDPAKYAFAFQLHTAENRLSTHRAVVDGLAEDVIIDRGLFGDLVFATTANRTGLISHHELVVYQSLLARRSKHRVTPDVLLYLRASPGACARRIASRGRDEEQGMDVTYLATLHKAHDQLLAQWKEGFLVPLLGAYPARVITKDWDEFGDVFDLVHEISSS